LLNFLFFQPKKCKKKKRDHDHLNDAHKALVKENESIKRQNKENAKEKLEMQKKLHDLTEMVSGAKKRELDLEIKLKDLVEQHEKCSIELENVKLELKLVNDTHREFVEKTE
jgi:hypothetical protein